MESSYTPTPNSPTITLTSSTPDYVTGSFQVTATLSEAMSGFTSNDITIANGTISNFSPKQLSSGVTRPIYGTRTVIVKDQNGTILDSDISQIQLGSTSSPPTYSETIYTFTVTPTNQGAVNVDIAANVATGNSGGNRAASTLTRIYDSLKPTIAQVSSTKPDGFYRVGDVENPTVIPITVTFSENIFLNTTTGKPQLRLNSGTNATAEYISNTENSITFHYTVKAGENAADLDYASTSALILNGSTIKDIAGNTANITLPVLDPTGSLADNNAIVIDTKAPKVVGVSSAVENKAYKAGDRISIGITFDEIVTVTGVPQLELETGTIDQLAQYKSISNDGKTLFFEYVVQEGDTSVDLDYLSTTALSLNGGTIRDQAGNNVVLTLPNPGGAGSLADNNAIVIDTKAPKVVGASSAVENKAYKAGDRISIGITFDEAVTVTGVPQLELETGTIDQLAQYKSISNDGKALFFEYVVQEGDTSVDLDYLSTTALSLNGGTIRDQAGNDILLALPNPGGAGSLADNNAIVIDTTAPVVQKVRVPTNKTYIDGDELAFFEVQFPEVVMVDTTGGKPIFDLMLDADTIVQATYVAGSGTDTLQFSYQVETGKLDTDGIQVGTQIILNNSIITDKAGNAAILTLNQINSTTGVLIDGVAPTVKAIIPPAEKTYKLGDTIDFNVQFTEAVTVNGKPQLAITLDNGSTVYASYQSGSNSDTLTFQYTVVAGNIDTNGIVIDSILLNNSTIQDIPGNRANLALDQVTTSTRIRVDGVVPTITNVTSPADNKTYKAGDTIDITVTFSEIVIVDDTNGKPQLKLATSDLGRLINYKNGSGTDTLTFTYTVQEGENSLDLGYVSDASLILNGGTVTDQAGNDVVLTLPVAGETNSLNSNKDIVIDTIAPTVLGVTSPNANAIYKAGDTIHIAVHFSEAIKLDLTNGMPQLKLAMSNEDGIATFAEISPDQKSLTFAYTVQAGNNTALLDYRSITSLLANGSNITDLVGNRANLNLPTPSSFNSLADDDIEVDTTAPNAPTDLVLDSTSDSGRFNTDKITKTITPVIQGKAEPNSIITLYEDNTILGTASVDHEGNWIITSRQLKDGVHSLRATATDAVGNVSILSNPLSITIDTTAPIAPAELVLDSDSGISSTDRLTKIASPVIKGKTEQNSIVKLYEGDQVLGSTVADDQGNWTIISTALSEGSHTLTATATDTAGNTGIASAPLNIAIDTIAPSAPVDLVLASHSSDSDRVTNVVTPLIQGKAEKNSTVTLYQDNRILGSATTDSNGNWAIISTNLADGTHEVMATATDAAGNISSRSAALTFTIDTIAPIAPSLPDLLEGSDTGTTNDDNYTNDTTPTLMGTAEANSRVSIFLGDALLGSVRTNQTGFWTYTPQALPQGTHNITSRATDAADNTSAASPTLVLTIDTTLPGAPSTPALISTSDSGISSIDRLTKETMPTLIGTAEANSRVNLYQGNTFIGATVANGKGSWSYIVDTPLADGAYRFRAVAIDQAGQMGASSGFLDITVDATAPNQPTGLTASRNADQWNKLAVNGVAEANSMVMLYEGNQLLGTTTANGEGQWSIAASSLTEGEHRFTTTATDAAGNQSQPSSMLQVSTYQSDTLFDASTGAFSLTTNLLNMDDELNSFSPGSLFQTGFKTTPRPDKVSGKVSNDFIRGLRANDRIDGKAGNDALAGGNGNDTVIGGAGNDLLFGGRQSDILVGGEGDDVLVGAMKADRLTGGAGKDKFVFRKGAERGDRITDFSTIDDLIVVSAANFNTGLQSGLLAVEQFHLGMKAQDENDRFLYKQGKLLFDADGNGSSRPMMLAQLKPGVELTNQNILVV